MKPRKIIAALTLAAALLAGTPAARADFDLARAISAAAKGVQAISISDSQMAAYARQSVQYMDSQNKVSDPASPYSRRLARLTAGLTAVDGTPLNFKVYEVSDINAFACPDGSVRVFSALMDLMTDDELLGIIGHEIGHVARHHSKKAMKQQLMTGALRDAIGASGGRLAALSDSQLGDLGQSLAGAKYSQKQEKEADDYGYDFLVAHGKNPWGMVMAFEKMQKMEATAPRTSYIAKMFSSHPDTRERIARLTKRATRSHIPRPN